MAFTGTPTVVMVSDRIVCITGLSLAGAAAGVIGLFGSGAEVELPEQFAPTVYAWQGTTVPLVASIEVTTKPAAVGVVTQIPITVVKAGATPALFSATLTNTTVATASPLLEIYVKFHE